jgi:uncharacterized cupredoxin-like copper-binding protein
VYTKSIASFDRTPFKINIFRATCAWAALLSVASCMPQQAKGPTSTDETQTLTYSVPLVTSVETGKETQDREGVTIGVVPVPFTISDKPSKTCAPIDTNSSTSMLGGLLNVGNGQQDAKKEYQITTQSGTDFEPKTLTFKLHIVNKTGHVMHLGDTYLKLNVSNNEVELSDSDMDKFHRTVLLPGEEKNFTIGGPDWSHNTDQSTIDFIVADLPLVIDPSGAVSKRDTFNWTYQAKLVTNTTQSKKTVETVTLTPGEATSMGCPAGPMPPTASK